MSFKLDAYCGLYCGGCFIMNAYRQNRTDCLPDNWINPIHDKEIKCYGCKSEIVFENCRGCRIRKCAQSKNIDFCNKCSEFPCEYIKRLVNLDLAHLNLTTENLKTIKETGVKKWLENQKNRWLCANCGFPYSWYEQNCVKCGKELFNSIKENKVLNHL
ncbi:MAG: DUF3795 domain-containing protein [Candidatus Lokiarchaeota archaeon]|nr:DUF3795 domain-containing protein [Candidatus Lokiarchaeota archaeon]